MVHCDRNIGSGSPLSRQEVEYKQQSVHEMHHENYYVPLSVVTNLHSSKTREEMENGSS